jgi:hypothetical protein
MIIIMYTVFLEVLRIKARDQLEMVFLCFCCFEFMQYIIVLTFVGVIFKNYF